jgi:hypothetical protein
MTDNAGEISRKKNNRHSGAASTVRAKRGQLAASPESITTIGGYGFRACAKRRIPE